MAPAAILDPQPGDKVLDLCAAPGGKTTQLQSLMADQGLLIANDPNSSRVQALARNLERWGGHSAAVLSETPQRLSAHFGSFFDRVLVDAPCSGEGTFRSDPGEIKKWSLSFSERMRVIQDEILWFAGKLVRPGGILVYSTCTFNKIENEGTLARFLETNQDFQLEAIPKIEGFSAGIQLAGQSGIDFSGAVRIWPHTSCGEGHFIARMRRKLVNAESDSFCRANTNLSPAARQIYQDFYDRTLLDTQHTRQIAPSSTALHLYVNRLYFTPENAPQLDGLRVIHWGWWLGTIQGDDFIPGPALASTLTTGDVQRVLEFSLEDPRLDAYRRGSPIKLSSQEAAPEGWILITTAGHTLGWGKLRNGRLKSYFPRWLRSI
jgi:NOL1/NOP2/fmu family ribosome biogenesis protein/23S rRNA U2552 (ribose-2'-O)-methylase RlmE/FtsJ